MQLHTWQSITPFYGRRSRGRQKKRWRDKIQEDLKTLKLKKEDADDRNKWRRRIRVADPSPRRDYFEPEGERERESITTTSKYLTINISCLCHQLNSPQNYS